MNKIPSIEEMEDVKEFLSEINKEGCPKNKCFLDLIYPNSEVGLACDMECYFKKGESGENLLNRYAIKNIEKLKTLKQNE